MAEKFIRTVICNTFYRYAKANNKYIKKIKNMIKIKYMMKIKN